MVDFALFQWHSARIPGCAGHGATVPSLTAQTEENVAAPHSCADE
jgi:hypothetical protein